MTISTHHIDNVIKAYTKQQRTRAFVEKETDRSGRDDAVTISGGEGIIAGKQERISYTLVDILTKKR